MSQVSLKTIEENYARMTDAQIKRILLKDATGLKPEVYEIIGKELIKRNLDINFIKGAIAQNQNYTQSEILNYVSIIQNLNCPCCNSIKQKLNAIAIHQLLSFLFISFYTNNICIACPDCLNTKNKNSIIITFLLGWWGIPSFLKTPYYIYLNYKNIEKIISTEPSSELTKFTISNIGAIETYKNDIQKLNGLIYHTILNEP